MALQPDHSHPFADGGFKPMLIGGAWVKSASGEALESLNPATGERLASFPAGDAEDIDRAVGAAQAALDGAWGRARPFDRQAALLRLAELVDRHFEELVSLDTLDMGMPISRIRGSRNRILGMLRYYAGQATMLNGETLENSLPGTVLSYTVKEPIGVVGAIIPWNSPLNSCVMKIGPALAAGCTIVVKPSEEASLTALRLAQLALESGLPEGTVNVVTGLGRTAGAALAAHPGVAKIAFTGSHETGQAIIHASAGNLKKLSLELGGKSPNIVFADADLDAAVPGAAMAVFANSGQICTAGTRLFVERGIYDDFVAKVAGYAAGLKLGDGMDPDTQIGPLVSARQLDRVMGYLDAGHREGARALAGGSRATDGDLAKGNFVPPTVFAGVRDDMRIAREEIFGPVLSAIPFDDMDDLVARANDTIYGLASGVWTRDIGKAHVMARRLKAGTVWINSYQLMDPNVPFGGYKMSGYGREGGPQHVEEFLNIKSVWIKAE